MLRRELKLMVSLAWPVVLAEVGWISMGIVDTIMVGPLGAEAIGAVGIGSNLFLALAIFGMGLLLGLDALVSQAFGGGRPERCHHWLVQGLYLSLLLAVPLVALSLASVSALPAIGIHGKVLDLTAPYLRHLTWSLVPLLLYAAFRRYLQGMHIVRPVTFALVSANVINLVGNWVLVYGHLGAPPFGVAGSAWATVISRSYMAAVLLGTILTRNRLRDFRWAPSFASLRELVRLGFPAAAQVVLEVAVFAAATALAGRLDAASLAAHQIAINIAGFAFMVPLGLSSAGAVRVGHAIGRGDSAAARRAGWMALALGETFMALTALSFVLAPEWLLGVFTADPIVIRTGVSLLGIAAVFQLFDGLQGVATGVLRGAGDTRTPMFTNLAGHWLIGLPIGYSLCFHAGWGVQGLWFGLSTGLIIVGTILIWAWWRQAALLASGTR